MKEQNTLKSIQNEIDVLDDKIVELISQRSHLVAKASSFENPVEEIKAQDRVDFVVQKVRKKAIELDVSPSMVADLFTIMVNEMVEGEISEFRNIENF